jgi:hypothetical protein
MKLRAISGPNTEQGRGGSTKLYEVLYSFTSPNTKGDQMKEHGTVIVAFLWEIRNANKILIGKSERKNRLQTNKWKDIIIKMGLKGIRCEGVACGSDSYGSGLGPVEDSCEHGNQLSNLTEGGQLLNHLCDFYFMKMDSVP